MPVASTAVNLVIIKVPFTLWSGGVPTSIVLEPAMGTFVSTATPLTVDGDIAVQEMHSYDYSKQWSRLEFVALNTNTAALETAVATLQASLITQNPGVTLSISAWAVTPSGAFRLVFS